MSVTGFLLSGLVRDFLVIRQPGHEGEVARYYHRFTNNTNYCYANSLFQALASLPPVVDLVTQSTDVNPVFNIIRSLLEKADGHTAIEISRAVKNEIQIGATFEMRGINRVQLFSHGNFEESIQFFLFILSVQKYQALTELFNIRTTYEYGDNQAVTIAQTGDHKEGDDGTNGSTVFVRIIADNLTKQTNIQNIDMINMVTLNVSINIPVITKLVSAPKTLCVEVMNGSGLNYLVVTENLTFLEHAYKLCAIVCYADEHYFSYCKRNEKWYKFNDKIGRVTDQTKAAHNANSTMVMIEHFDDVRRGIMDKLTSILFYSKI